MKHKKFDFFKFINAALIIVGCVGFILPFLVLHKSNDSDNASLTVSLASVAGYFRFLAGNKNQMFIDIALHNIAIAVFGFIISFFSRGILGSLVLFLNLFVLGTVLFDIHTPFTIIFVMLEFIGICVAVFGGTYLSKKMVLQHASTKDIFRSSFFVVLFIAVTYFVAAFIESNVILNQW